MNESLVKYLAGLLDADGSLSFSFRRDTNRENCFFFTLRLSLASSDAVDQRGFVSGLPESTGMGSISRYGNHQQFVNWTVNRRTHVEMLLPRLIKHMVIKAQHWQWMLESWRDLRSKTLTADERQLLLEAGRESRKTRHGPIKPKNHPTWAWLAGYLDGDGWYRRRYSPQQNYWSMHVGAAAHNRDAAVLSFLQKAFGGSIREHGQSEHVSVWVRNLGIRDRSFALRFLPYVAKHSKLKRHKIDQMIWHHRQRLSVPGPKGQATV